MKQTLHNLAESFAGTIHQDDLTRSIYATDASAYQETPRAVAIPRSVDDLRLLIQFASENGVGLIPRTAGTSLAGQVVGDGIVVDVSKHFTRILEIHATERWVRVQPGVIRNELNQALATHGMLFGPETSTQNRAMMGGMLGNNSCGSNSIRYGSTRDHVLEVTALLADGSEAVFGPLSEEEFRDKGQENTLEAGIYRGIDRLLSPAPVREEIAKHFPHPEIRRRNTGYAVDLLADATCFDPSSPHPFHFGKLIAGSEGTLCFVTEMKLACQPLPPPTSGLLCAHFESVGDALRATQRIVQFDCYACELIDRYILDATKRSREHRENRFFLEGDPAAVIVAEIRGHNESEVKKVTDAMTNELRQQGLGYAYPVLFGENTEKIWNLRKAGLGLLSNMPGDAKPAPVVEDTAVDVADLPDYIAEFNGALREEFGLECVHYAHAGSGEIHLRPILNLKTREGHAQYRGVAETIARLVKRYRGSLSGEHGDGRLRGEFIPDMVGQKNYQLLRQIKQLWDPQCIFNPGKIVDTPPMDQSLRFQPGQEPKQIATQFDWSSTDGFARAAEMCNGSGDCRKTHLTGGTMCPSYMATKDEKDTTRARANMLRIVLNEPSSAHPLDDPRLKDVMDLCLSCKGCKKECPSTVDMAKLKAEYLQHVNDAHGVSWRNRMAAMYPDLQRWAAWFPAVWNGVLGNATMRRITNRWMGFHPERSIPTLSTRSLSRWFSTHVPHPNAGSVGKVWLFNDEFTGMTESHIGIAAVELLERLGYAVEIPKHGDSARTRLSKGMLRDAKRRIENNVDLLAPLISDDQPLVGIEPSAILTFHDESLDLASPSRKAKHQRLADHSYQLEDFLAREIQARRVTAEAFTDQPKTLHVHGHCFQKALTGMEGTRQALRLPKNYQVRMIRSGCCGMAGSFGYEQEHFQLSQQIGRLVLFPTIDQIGEEDVVVAPGASCRHQIQDGTGRRALHPAEVLRRALDPSLE